MFDRIFRLHTKIISGYFTDLVGLILTPYIYNQATFHIKWLFATCLQTYLLLCCLYVILLYPFNHFVVCFIAFCLDLILVSWGGWAMNASPIKLLPLTHHHSFWACGFGVPPQEYQWPPSGCPPFKNILEALFGRRQGSSMLGSQATMEKSWLLISVQFPISDRSHFHSLTTQNYVC